MDCSLPGSSSHGIFQARVLEWVAISFSRVSSKSRDQTQVTRIVNKTLYHLSHQGRGQQFFHNSSSEITEEKLLPKGICGFRCSLPINRPSWWKGNFALFQMQALVSEWGGDRHLSKGQFPSPDKPGVRAFIDRVREGCSMQKQHSHLRQSTPNWSSVIWPASSWLVQIQLLFSLRVHLFPLLCGQFSELWQLMSWVQSGHHVVNFSNWRFSIYKMTHRTWLRILSLATEKELKVLDYA